MAAQAERKTVKVRTVREHQTVQFDRFSAIDDHFYTSIVSEKPLSGQRTREMLQDFLADLESDSNIDHDSLTEVSAFVRTITDPNTIPRGEPGEGTPSPKAHTNGLKGDEDQMEVEDEEEKEEKKHKDKRKKDKGKEKVDEAKSPSKPKDKASKDKAKAKDSEKEKSKSKTPSSDKQKEKSKRK